MIKLSFKKYIKYIKHISLKEYNNLPLETRLQIKREYHITYGF